MKKAPPDASSGATLSPKAVGAIDRIIPKKGRSPKATALMRAHEKRPERQAERGDCD